MRFALMCALLLAAPAAVAGRWRAPNGEETALFAISEALLVLDTWQTLDIKNQIGAYERNPFLGRHPSNARIFATAGLGMGATAVGWYLLPDPWRNILTFSIVAVETVNVTWNASMGMRFRIP